MNLPASSDALISDVWFIAVERVEYSSLRELWVVTKADKSHRAAINTLTARTSGVSTVAGFCSSRVNRRSTTVCWRHNKIDEYKYTKHLW